MFEFLLILATPAPPPGRCGNKILGLFTCHWGAFPALQLKTSQKGKGEHPELAAGPAVSAARNP